MAEKTQQVHFLAPSTNHVRSDEVEEELVVNLQSKELRLKKRMKCMFYIAAFTVFHTMIILVFALIVLCVKTLKLRLGTITVNNIVIGTQPSPSFNMSVVAHFRVKNTNFGHYKYDIGTITFKYGEIIVGQAPIPNGHARVRSNKKSNVPVDLDYEVMSLTSNTLQLGNDINYGFLKLSIYSKFSGEVKLLKVIKKKKSAVMNYTMSVNLSSNVVQDLKCH